MLIVRTVLVLCALVVAAEAATVCVQAGASSTGTGACWSRPYPTIQKAIDRTASDDIILIGAGTYYEALRLDGRGARELRGAGASLTILAPPGGSKIGIHVLAGSSLTVRDLSFDRFEYYAILSETATPMTVSDCRFNRSGIHMESAASLIERNWFQDIAVTAITVAASSANGTVRIRDNDFLDATYGVLATDLVAGEGGQTWLAVLDNSFEGAFAAVMLDDPRARASIYGNYFGFGDSGIDIDGGESVGVWNNVFDANSGDAIRTTLGAGVIAHNSMRNNGGAAINCYTAVWNDESLIVNNAMLANGRGLSVDAGCHARVQANAGYANTGGDFVGLKAIYNLGGNTGGLPFWFTDTFVPTSSASILIGRAAPVGAHMQLDYFSRSRAVDPEIGAVEYVPRN